MIVLSRNSGYEDEQRLKRLRDTLEVGLQRKTSSNQLAALPEETKTVSRKAKHYFANMFSPFGSVHTAELNRPSTTPRLSVANLTSFCTFVLSEKQETLRRIARAYREAAQLTVDNTLTLKEKMSRIATYLGALVLILYSKVCHGDLKPENILWDDDHFVISDFNGSILIEDVCKLMNAEFQLESDEYRNKLSTVVMAFCKKSTQLEAVCKAHPVQVRKLVKWGLVNEDRQILNEERLKVLNSYLRTKFFPDHSKGYASEQYLKKMGDYFWQCDVANYENVAQAFDIRSAGLTIYVILTGARPPLKEDDTAYYDTLERSLNDLGISPRATSLIRRMAEPVVKKFCKTFSMPVTMDELEELERIFADKPIIDITDTPPIGSPRESFRSEGHLKEALVTLQETIERLSLIEGDDEDSEKHNAMNNLIKALSVDDITQLGRSEKLNVTTRKEIIQQAFESFPTSCEMIRTINGQTHTILLLLDKYNLHRCDVLLKKEVLGDGASAVAFKALSLRSLRYVVVKYFQELADPKEAEHAQLILSQIGSHEGVQSVTQPFEVKTDEGMKKVVIDAYYKKRDYGAAVHGEILCARLLLPREHWGDCERVKTALTDVNRELLQVLLSNRAVQDKQLKLRSFIEDYGNSLIAILGIHKGKQLLEDYNSLITESTPIPPSEPVKEEEEKKSPRKFTFLSFGVNSPKSPRSPRISPRQPLSPSRRNSINAESLSWIDSELEDPSKPTPADATIEVINVKAFEMLLKDPNLISDYRDEVKTNARQITLKAIRDCQRLILLDYLKDNSDPQVDVNPAIQSRTWQRQAENMGDTHLDIKGINHVSRLVGVEAQVEIDHNNFRQRTLTQLLDIKAQVWKITG